MHQTTSQLTFLHVYDVDSGLWVHTELVTPVSSPTLEAMNFILDKDGIKAFIGTRLEFGTYVTELLKETEGVTVRSWISYPVYTIMSKLGLCTSTSVTGKPEMAFYGSPVLLMLAVLIAKRSYHGDVLYHWQMDIKMATRGYASLNGELTHLGVKASEVMITASEYEEARTYYLEFLQRHRNPASI